MIPKILPKKNNEKKYILPDIEPKKKKITKSRVVYKLPLDMFRILNRIVFPNGLNYQK